MTKTSTPAWGRLSRQARIHDLEAATRELAVEYQESSLPNYATLGLRPVQPRSCPQGWRFAEVGTAFGTVRSEALPANLAEGEMADHLYQAIAQLEEFAEGFAAIDAPVIGARRADTKGATT